VFVTVTKEGKLAIESKPNQDTRDVVFATRRLDENPYCV